MNINEIQSKWKVFKEESYKTEKLVNKKGQKWRYYELRGKYGMIYPYSENQLAVFFKSNRIGKSLVKRSGWVSVVEGENEAIFLFPLEDLDLTARTIKARKRRHISKDHHIRLISGRQQPEHSQKNLSNGQVSRSGLAEKLIIDPEHARIDTESESDLQKGIEQG